MLAEDSCMLLQKSLSVFFPVLVNLHLGWQHTGLETEHLLKARKATFLLNQSVKYGFFTCNFSFS